MLITISNIYHKVYQSGNTTLLTHPTEWEHHHHHVLLYQPLGTRSIYLSKSSLSLSIPCEEWDKETKTLTSGLVHKVNLSEMVTFFGPGLLGFFLPLSFPPVHLPCNFHCQVFKSKMQATGAEAHCLVFSALPAEITTKIHCKWKKPN